MAGRKNNHPYGLTIFSKKLNRQLSHSAPEAHPALPRIRSAHSLPPLLKIAQTQAGVYPAAAIDPKKNRKK